MKLRHKVLLYALMSLFATFGAQAHDIENGTGVICDTPDQLRDFAAKGSSPEAVQQVNAAAQKNACAFAQVAYVRGAEQGNVMSHGKPVVVTEILVIAFHNGVAWQRLPQPSVQYTLFALQGEPA